MWTAKFKKTKTGKKKKLKSTKLANQMLTVQRERDLLRLNNKDLSFI